MRIKFILIIIFLAAICSACGAKAIGDSANNTSAASGATKGAASNTSIGDADKKTDPTPATVMANQPKTIRDFFMLLPEKYFLLEGCVREKDKDCRKAKVDYLKTFTEVEDTANGYLKGGCDGAQSCLEMAIFKRPDGTYLVGVATSGEMMNDYYFLDYANESWTDISATAVPQFSRKNMYELPRQGTTVKVFAKKVIEKGDDYEVSDKGEKLYDLEWKNGRFTIKK
jgi:hypothetical protein